MYIYFPKLNAYIYPGPYLGFIMDDSRDTLMIANKFEREYINDNDDGAFFIKFKTEDKEEYLYLSVVIDIVNPTNNKQLATMFYNNDNRLDIGKGRYLMLDKNSTYLATVFCKKYKEEENDKFECILGE
jgi:hypothetical protein